MYYAPVLKQWLIPGFLKPIHVARKSVVQTGFCLQTRHTFLIFSDFTDITVKPDSKTCSDERFQGLAIVSNYYTVSYFKAGPLQEVLESSTKRSRHWLGELCIQIISLNLKSPLYKWSCASHCAKGDPLPYSINPRSFSFASWKYTTRRAQFLLLVYQQQHDFGEDLILSSLQTKSLWLGLKVLKKKTYLSRKWDEKLKCKTNIDL